MGPLWVDEWEGHVYVYCLGETEEVRSNDDRRHNTCTFNKVLLRGEV